jgi:hypothetical protein
VKHLKLIVGTLLALAVVLGLTALGGPDVTQARVQGSLTPTFTNLYLDQQQALGHTGVTAASMHTSSDCTRGGGTVAPVGPGSDWVCMVSWTDDTNTPVTGKFELQVHSSSCWTASGPASLIGSFTLTDATGRDVPNPVNAFDGCFDPDSAAAPTSRVGGA